MRNTIFDQSGQTVVGSQTNINGGEIECDVCRSDKFGDAPMSFTIRRCAKCNKGLCSFHIRFLYNPFTAEEVCTLCPSCNADARKISDQFTAKLILMSEQWKDEFRRWRDDKNRNSGDDKKI